MDELIVVNKPINLTSRDVVNEVCHILNTKKVGHTGTLDPIATGVLVILTGKYTKLVDVITSMDKEYIAKIKLGIKTDTADITGNVIEKRDVKITYEKVKEVFDNFPKTYIQTVPKYSAVKINGKKLYEYARSNIDIDLPKRSVNIYTLELLEVTSDTITFKTKVSKGTYIRSLITDLCDKLNIIGTMSSLTRTKQGKFDIKDSYTLEDLKTNNYKGLKINEFLDYEVIEVNDNEYKKIINGNKIKNIYNISDKVIFSYNNKFLAIYESINDYLKPFIML